jgi:hypothetical protein
MSSTPWRSTGTKLPVAEIVVGPPGVVKLCLVLPLSLQQTKGDHSRKREEICRTVSQVLTMR